MFSGLTDGIRSENGPPPGAGVNSFSSSLLALVDCVNAVATASDNNLIFCFIRRVSADL